MNRNEIRGASNDELFDRFLDLYMVMVAAEAFNRMSADKQSPLRAELVILRAEMMSRMNLGTQP